MRIGERSRKSKRRTQSHDQADQRRVARAAYGCRYGYRRLAARAPSAVAIERADQLPDLIDKATRCLASARTSAEVLEAKVVAEAAWAFAKVIKAAIETQADCLRMIVRAEMRMADEIDRGQANGEVASAGDNPIVRASDNQVLTYEALGIDRRRVSEWRELRDAGEEAVERAIEAALAEGRAPTKSDIHRSRWPHPPGSGSVEWYTPAIYIETARQALGGEFDLDPANCVKANERVRARIYFTRADNGLSKPWHGRIWCNPPYCDRRRVRR
jgi:hypothetical protein